MMLSPTAATWHGHPGRCGQHLSCLRWRRELDPVGFVPDRSMRPPGWLQVCGTWAHSPGLSPHWRCPAAPETQSTPSPGSLAPLSQERTQPPCKPAHTHCTVSIVLAIQLQFAQAGHQLLPAASSTQVTCLHRVSTVGPTAGG